MKLVYKPDTITSHQAVKLFKQKFPEFKNTTVSYAGRLDPMAEGLLLLLIDNENKNRKQFEGLEKTYEFSVVFGIATDSYDILGIIRKEPQSIPTDFEERLNKVLPSFLGKKTQQFPPFSSKPVNGKPLYYWAKRNLLDQVIIPEKQVTITHLQIIKQKEITGKALFDKIVSRVNKVSGDFRQQEIIHAWNKFFNSRTNTCFPLITFSVTCSSGTYARGIANQLGEKLTCGGICLNIKRTQIGSYLLTDAIMLD